MVQTVHTAQDARREVWTNPHVHTSRTTNYRPGTKNNRRIVTLFIPIHEFPEDVFTKEQRTRGAVLLHAIYMFYALAIVCDDYFVPSLEKISENLHLSEDVAGATFMAAGSSAPELFTSLIGVFITKGDVGVGTIVGSAVFNILVIIGLCGIFAGQTVVLTWWESLMLMSMYGVYIILMKFNSQILGVVTRRFRGPGQCCGSREPCEQKMTEEPPASCTTTMVLLSKGLRSRLISSPKTQLDGDGAPRSRLGSSSQALKACASPCGLENGGGGGGNGDVEKAASDGANADGGGKTGAEACVPEEEEEGDDGTFRPLRIPGGVSARAKWLLSWPLGLLLYCTVPNCQRPRWHRWFMVTFAASTLVPDCMASLIVARQGMGDMAVSNSIGSNIFDILLGLGFPWALRTLIVDHGSVVSINNKGLVYSVVLLLASVFLTVSSVHLNHWRLDRRLGLGLLFLYSIFLLCSILFGQM
ncbi:hypothetical protein CRUP_038172 [Coryphaenoides rupestris]|nr:hypothetical protein CRUP_038172 [Coryphaenoides rupestris]